MAILVFLYSMLNRIYYIVYSIDSIPFTVYGYRTLPMHSSFGICFSYELLKLSTEGQRLLSKYGSVELPESFQQTLIEARTQKGKECVF